MATTHPASDSLGDFPGDFPRDPGYLRSKLPPRDATVKGPVGTEVVIRWDAWGIPHIRAQSRRDLFFGLGYATAQECLWRMEYCRRLARGRLAAILGPDALPSDRLMRLLGIGRDADLRAAHEPEPVAEALDALARGVNQWIDHAIAHRLLPVEFDWLGFEPVPWTPADSIACWKQRWWTLTGRLENVALAEAARRHLPPELLPAFLAVELGEETILPDDSQFEPRVSGAGAPGGADEGEGSNNWVVAGSRTTTGHPVLCSDPHNPFTQPGQWLQAQLTLEDGSLDVAGAIYATTPGVYFGRNRLVAWGFTNHVAPVRDLYVETVDPSRPGAYLETGAWRPFDVSTEEIDVRGAPSETFEVRRTVRGPVVDAFLPSLGEDEPPITLRWLGTEMGSGFDAFLALNAARSAREAADVMRRWTLPVANLLTADSGHIAYHAVGHVPRRIESARRYRDAQDPRDAWQGFLGYDDLPHAEDPARGWLATANQPPWRRDPPGLSYVAGAAWPDGGRMRRIRRRLEAADRHTPENLASIQADVTSVRAADLVPALTRLLRSARETAEPDPRIPPAAALLDGWDHRYTLESAAPTIWTAFWDHWLRRVTAARLPADLVALTHTQAGAVARALLLGRDTTPSWLGSRDLAAEVAAAFSEALRWLAERFGPSPDDWQWGKVHTVTWTHALSHHGPPALRRAAAEVFDVGPFPTIGGPTVRAAGYGASRPYHVNGGATYRLVADLSPHGGLVATTTTGNSGHPASPHYDDQAALWLADQYHPFPMDDFEPEGVTRIEPAGGR